MTNLALMKKYLQQNVLSELERIGFSGKYPHYRREQDNCMELISFQTNSWGGSFTVEVSAAFPLAESLEDKNFYLYDDITEKDITVWNTMERYRLKGMFDGWFYYRDVYCKQVLGFGKTYLDVSEKDSSSFHAPAGYQCVQIFNEETAKKICAELNRQLQTAFRWLEKFKKRNRK